MTRSRHPVSTLVTLLASIAAITLLYVPLIAVAVQSLRGDGRWSLASYRKLFANRDILEAAGNTFVLAAASTIVATVLGTLLAIGISRHPWGRRMRALHGTLLYVPVVMPDLIFAATLLVAFTVLRQASAVFEFGMLTMIIGHVTFQIAFVALVVQSRLATIPPAIEEAARDLYASSWQVLTRVTLPLLAPGIVAGALLAVTLSLDDFVISFFTSGTTKTLPILVYTQVGRQGRVAPEYQALTTVIFFGTVLLVLGVERMTRRSRT